MYYLSGYIWSFHWGWAGGQASDSKLSDYVENRQLSEYVKYEFVFVIFGRMHESCDNFQHGGEGVGQVSNIICQTM
jgi:hypothetical protein